MRRREAASTEAVPSASAVRSWSIACARSSKRSKLRLTASGRPAILVPLPTATDDHQRKNAEVLGRAGAGLVMEERDLSGARLAETIAMLVADPDRRRHMSAAARRLARPDAAARIADRVEQLAPRPRLEQGGRRAG